MKSDHHLSYLSQVPEVIYQVLAEPLSREEMQNVSDVPQTLEDFMSEVNDKGNLDAKRFAIKLREMVSLTHLEIRHRCISSSTNLDGNI